jgi:hypothetical protein
MVVVCLQLNLGVRQPTSEKSVATSWTRLDQQILLPLLQSGQTYELAPSERPRWAQGHHQFLRFFAYSVAPGESLPSVGTTGEVVGRLLSERYDKKDEAPYNYNWYWIVQSSPGPIITLDHIVTSTSDII